MQPIPPNQQRALVDRLAKMCGGGYTPDVRRKYFISGPQWAAAYQGQALFYAPTREPVTFEHVIREFGFGVNDGLRMYLGHMSLSVQRISASVTGEPSTVPTHRNFQMLRFTDTMAQRITN